ncbi:FAD-binding oxidoreductase [Alteromonas sediminis]|uniref:D-2-hydroxyglutarate dehydrogenase n=1 Tax=Alteromonas sediminis TaxID=2259342 RepID=A0A3N5Y630_9ALTE|nr:FAD-binding and (Fe-S)-binding domain-containing protein [Alteromonas sediminis]RPJ68726.1 FAD-binding oxidoreductase [Alteromonas sediminis]
MRINDVGVEWLSLPALKPESGLSQSYIAFIEALQQSAFQGDIETSYGSRLAMATDNSVYQKMPQAVIFPTSTDDCEIIGKLANVHTDVKFSARGGGTGTNGQSLTDGIVVDIRRYLNQVLEINVEQGWVRVQAGVVKDALNDALRPHGFFFSPDLSTSNRATLGGMISTDASGQGSLVYGKTSDHVLGLTAVLANGERIETSPVKMDVAREKAKHNTQEAGIYRQVIDTCIAHRDAIIEKFPRLNRFLTGYDLEHAYNPDNDTVDIGRLITGAEGSLAMVTEAKLSLTPIATCKALVNIKYDSFDAALRHAPAMVAAQATSVETVDSTVLNLAKTDIIWHSISDLITDVPNKTLLGLNMVEYNADSVDEMREKIEALEQKLKAESAESGVIGYQITYDDDAIKRIYAMRKKAVGLLGKTKGERKPIAFAEDTAVPPEKLADFILEFRALLDGHGLQYGMFGHVDAGVLHVRPALDLCDTEQEKLMHKLSDQVVELVAKYGGLMWGEHGKGYRSEYGPAFFGEFLFTELRKIKTAFDPFNQMNPGKICTPLASSESLVRVTDPKRATLDRAIPVAFKETMAPAMSCNGNGLCFNYDARSPMCPSSKITSDRRHTPKGRAGIIREWLRLLGKENVDTTELSHNQFSTSFWERFTHTVLRRERQDFSHEVLEVMNGCLACKSCTSQCPVNVDVPDFRAKFLAIYYRRYMRPLKDIMVANVEKMTPLLAGMPKLVNGIMASKPVAWLLENKLGYVDTPQLSYPTLKAQVNDTVEPFSLEQLERLSLDERQQYVAIVQDPFTSFYDATVVADFAKLIKVLGLKPVLLPFLPNGKPAHVKGFLNEFARTAKNTADFLNKVAELDIPLVGVDASLVLCYRDEYVKTLGKARGDFNVLTVHEWLADLPTAVWKNKTKTNETFALVAHCTEKTALPKTEQTWQKVFEKIGCSLTIVPVGCCGMAGTYGHEKDNLEKSIGIFNLSWTSVFERFPVDSVLATGFSCRSQVNRIQGNKPKHPLQALLQQLQKSK